MRLTLVLALLLSTTGCGWIKGLFEQQAEKAKAKATEAAKNALAEAQKQAQQPAVNINVERKDAPTPEVRSTVPRGITTGQTADIVLTGTFGDVKDVTAGEICHVKQWKTVSPTEIRLTITADDRVGDCPITLQTGGRNAGVYLEVQASAAAKAQHEREQQQEAQEQQAKAEKEIQQRLEIAGTKWSVKLPSGKADEWTRYETLPGGITRFKSKSGTTFMVVASPDGTVAAQSEDGSCLFSGNVDNGRVSGQSILPKCSLGSGAFTATVSK
jgi:hypothetical protein